ncbi:uncharacterized protein LOC122296775 [Carya illinoinensis]|uniref:uncharacterized protein LOC122296775 n=1 Tax=Carya illinoinensis TaxID=32201 RepID=UPI001C728017|nr:uncharacterized protein LOC122296775 [Carya illinoinensis]
MHAALPQAVSHANQASMRRPMRMPSVVSGFARPTSTPRPSQAPARLACTPRPSQVAARPTCLPRPSLVRGHAQAPAHHQSAPRPTPGHAKQQQAMTTVPHQPDHQATMTRSCNTTPPTSEPA